MLVCLLLLLSAPQETRDYEKWLEEEVVYLISAREREEFAGLETDEQRERFIDRFWKRRDPDPSTVLNEFRREHFRRIEYANQHYRGEGVPGWRTARGRAYIIHGPPDNISYTFGARQKVFVRNPTDILNKTGTQQPVIDVSFPSPESETWVYRYLPGGSFFRQNFTIIFAKMAPEELYHLQQIVASVGNATALEPRRRRDLTILRFKRQQSYMRNDYRVVYAGEPRFADLPDLLVAAFDPTRSKLIDRFEILRAEADLYEPSGELLEEREKRRRKMKEMVEQRVFFRKLPLSVGYAFLRSVQGHVEIPLHVRIGLDPEAPVKELDLMAELVRADGVVAAAFQDRIRRLSKGAQSDLSYHSRLGAHPGEYRLRVVVSDIVNQALGIWEEDIEVPVLVGEGFSASELILCEQVIPHDQFRGQAETRTRRDWLVYSRQNPLRLDDWIFVPSADHRFRRLQNLTALVEVYNPTLGRDQRPEVQVQAICQRGGEGPVAATDVKQLGYLTGENKDIIVYALSFPLRSLDPGDYDVMVRIIDQPSGHTLRKSASFRIY